MSDGTTKRIDSVSIGDEVFSMGEDHSVLKSKVTAAFQTGEKEAYRVRLYGGMEVVASADHPFYAVTGTARKRIPGRINIVNKKHTLKNGESVIYQSNDPRMNVPTSFEWKKVSELEKGTYVAVPRAVPRVKFDIDPYPLNHYELLGYILGDGTVAQGNMVGFTNSDADVVSRMKEIVPDYVELRSSGGINYRLSSDERTPEGYGKNSLVNLYREFGIMGCRSNSKFIPKFVFQSSDEAIYAILGGLFATDGWVDASKNALGYGSISKQLRDDVAHLLRLIGVVPATREKTSKCYNSKKENYTVKSYELSVARGIDLAKLAKVLNFPGPRYKKLMAAAEAKSTSSIYGINTIFYVGDLQFIKIERIEKMPPINMWDLTIEGTHNFVGNGIILHNSLAGAAEMVRYLIENPGSRVMVVAPSYPMLYRAAIEYLVPMLPPGLFKSKNDQRHEIILTNGCKIWMASLDNPDSVRGPTVAAIWADEASYFTDSSFDLLLFRLRQTGYKHKIWLTTTPRGRNYIWKLWVDAPSKNPELKKDWHFVQFRTEDNPWFPRQQLMALKARLEGTPWGRQELLGEFSSFEGAIYPQFDPNTHVGDYADKPKENWKSIMYGVDWGYVDATCMLVIGLDSDNRIHVLEEMYKTGLTMPEVVDEAKKLVAKWGPGRFICDSAGQTQIATFNKAGLPASDAYKAIQEGITMVASRLVKRDDGLPRILVDKSCINLIREMGDYHFKELKEGDFSKPEPARGQSDHAVDVLRYLCAEVDGGQQSWGNVTNQGVLDAINGKGTDLGPVNRLDYTRFPRPKALWGGVFGTRRFKY